VGSLSILKGAIQRSRDTWLESSDVRFAAGVVRDAEKLNWKEGQLGRRKRALESAMADYNAVAWEEEAGLYGLEGVNEGELFKRHGWNRVDSGFQLWGTDAKGEDKQKGDKFLESKGWNDMESGFRIF